MSIKGSLLTLRGLDLIQVSEVVTQNRADILLSYVMKYHNHNEVTPWLQHVKPSF
jgi:hypothetical protein